VSACGGLNVFIGRNNAGKSSVLATIDLALTHLKKARLSTYWETARREQDEFHVRDTSRPIQIGLEFELEPLVNAELRAQLRKEAPQFERAIEELASCDVLSVIIAGAADSERAFLFVQAVGAGPIDAAQPDIQLSGISLLQVPLEAGKELARFDRQVADLRKEAAALEQMATDPNSMTQMLFNDKKDVDRLRYVVSRQLDEPHPGLTSALMPIMMASDNAADFARSVLQLAADRKEKAHQIERQPTSTAVAAYAGDVNTPPAYATWLMRQCGSTRLLHLRENKAPIGTEEAAALLGLKVRRGGEERLRIVRQTVQSLLGVSVDAFEPDEGDVERRAQARRLRRPAEMDIDNFLVEANGAGIREALRLILDIELKTPDLVLLEEPEIHLHPGLEHAMHGYLREKSRHLQAFMTTHSTNFVDTAALQNVYLVSRDGERRTTCNTLLLDAAMDRIPTELGLRLSSVFMFDRLIFVEGKSDEDVLRELARRLGIDLAAANIGFVQMGGVRNFAHFAADATLELLSRRQVKIWFIVDRDERDDTDIAALLTRLGENAKLCVLERRELDNYLAVPRAVAGLAAEKLRMGGRRVDPPTEAAAKLALDAAALALKDEVIRLRIEHAMLRPIYFIGREQSGSVEERMARAIADITQRQADWASASERIRAAVDSAWPTEAWQRAPGALMLDKALHALAGLRYSKTGDGPRLARLLDDSEIAPELVALLRDAAAPGSRTRPPN
jgi:putative ATP-dependent endonuclease of OLD family